MQCIGIRFFPLRHLAFKDETWDDVSGLPTALSYVSVRANNLKVAYQCCEVGKPLCYHLRSAFISVQSSADDPWMARIYQMPRQIQIRRARSSVICGPLGWLRRRLIVTQLKLYHSMAFIVSSAVLETATIFVIWWMIIWGKHECKLFLKKLRSWSC